VLTQLTCVVVHRKGDTASAPKKGSKANTVFLRIISLPPFIGDSSEMELTRTLTTKRRGDTKMDGQTKNASMVLIQFTIVPTINPGKPVK
jgi:hypothetical protein